MSVRDERINASFDSHVAARLAVHEQREHGRPLAQLLADALEHAADAAGRCRTASETLDRADLEPQAREAIRDALDAAQALAGQAWQQLDRSAAELCENDSGEGAGGPFFAEGVFGGCPKRVVPSVSTWGVSASHSVQVSE